MSEKKRPLGLGSMGANKAAKVAQEQEESAGEAETMFQMPEGEMSEEAEIKTIFIGAEAAYADFKAMDEEELEEDAGKPEEEQIRTRAIKLYSGVVHECDRVLKLADLDVEEEPLAPVIFELMGDALYRLGCIERDTAQEYFLAAKDKYDAGLEAYPRSVGLIFSKARLEMYSAVQADEDGLLEELRAITKDLPALCSLMERETLSKMRQSLGEFCETIEDPDVIEFVARLWLELESVPVGAEKIMYAEDSLERASWLAKLIEACLGKDLVKLEEVSTRLAELESALDLECSDEPETQITLGQLRAQLQLLKGSKLGIEGKPEEEQQCYEEAHRVFRDLESRYGCPVPDFIHALLDTDSDV